MHIEPTQKRRDPIKRKQRMSKFYENDAILKNLLDNVVPPGYRDEIFANFRDHELEFDFWEMNFTSTTEALSITCLVRKPSQGLLKPKPDTVTITFRYAELKSHLKEA